MLNQKSCQLTIYNEACDVCGGTMNLQIDESHLILNVKNVALLQGNAVGLCSSPGA